MMILNKLKRLILALFITMICACNGFFDKDNMPLPQAVPPVKAEIFFQRLWSAVTPATQTGTSLNLKPALTPSLIYTATPAGYVTAILKTTGQHVWQKAIGQSITASPIVSGDIIVIVTQTNVYALESSNGKQRWQMPLPCEVLATPVIAHDKIIIKTLDGQLLAYATLDGHLTWHNQQTEPSLLLRRASTPLADANNLYVGFANGQLGKFSLQTGALLWQKTITLPEGAFAIQRMVDIAADPIIYNNRLYIATYQGHLAAIDMATGDEHWARSFSSYAGLIANDNRLYGVAANSMLWAFNATNGQPVWQQQELLGHVVTAPVLFKDYIVIGDAEGYLNCFSRKDGHLAARQRVSNKAILTAPLADTNTLYVFSVDGHLAAYKLTL